VPFGCIFSGRKKKIKKVEKVLAKSGLVCYYYKALSPRGIANTKKVKNILKKVLTKLLKCVIL